MSTKTRVAFVKRAVAGLLCFCGSNVLAAGYSGWSIIKDFQVGNADIYVMLDPAVVANVNSCTYWAGWFRLYNGTYTLNSFDLAKVSSALAARMAGKLVNIYSAACNAGYNNLDSIQIKAD